MRREKESILKYDCLMYERVFQILKNKIESGLLPAGSSLPSRINLQREFDTSEKTIRHALAMLEEEGLIQTHQRKRPVVSPNQDWGHLVTRLAVKKMNAGFTSDLLKTGVLLSYPLIKSGLNLCRQEDLEIPRKMLDNIDVENADEFWRQTKRFVRFFIARNENQLCLCAVDSLGLEELKPSVDTIEIRKELYKQLEEFMYIIESGQSPENTYFDDLSDLYRFSYGKEFLFDVPSDSALVLGKKQMEKLLEGAEVRYSAVYMDLLGLIAMGRYQLGDKLPTYKELQKLYNVSLDTAGKAIQIMQEWGVVKTIRGKGIFVEMDLSEMKKIQISPRLIAYHVRRYLDSMELLALTIEGASVCAAAHITAEEIEAAKANTDYLWNVDFLYGRSPSILLKMITEHIDIDALHTIYTLLQRNLRIGRSIPALVDTVKTAENIHIHGQCEEALEILSGGNHEAFSMKSSQIFQYIYRLVIQECKKLGYYEPAMKVYDGSALWK